MTQQAYYSASILQFSEIDTQNILNHLSDEAQAIWQSKIDLLKTQFNQLPHLAGDVILGFNQPKLELDTEVVILYRGLVFVVSIGSDNGQYDEQQMSQLHKQALRLKKHHLGSQTKFIIPVSIETKASPQPSPITVSEDLVAGTMCDNGEHLAALIEHFSNQYKDDQILLDEWLESGFTLVSSSSISESSS